MPAPKASLMNRAEGWATALTARIYAGTGRVCDPPSRATSAVGGRSHRQTSFPVLMYAAPLWRRAHENVEEPNRRNKHAKAGHDRRKSGKEEQWNGKQGWEDNAGRDRQVPSEAWQMPRR